MEIIIGIIVVGVIWYFFRLKGKSKSQIELGGNSIDRIVKNSEELLSSNYTKIKKIAQKTISKSYLTGCSWLLVNNENDENIIYTFRNNNELLVTKNGIVERYNFELIVDNNSILITKNNITEHFDIVNIQDDFLYLNKLSSESVMVFANQTKFKDYLKSELNKMVKRSYNESKINQYDEEDHFDISMKLHGPK